MAEITHYVLDGTKIVKEYRTTSFGISKSVLSIVYTTVIAKYMYEDEKHNKLYMILRKTYSDCDSAYNYDWHSVTYEPKHPELKYYVGIKQIGIQP